MFKFEIAIDVGSIHTLNSNCSDTLDFNCSDIQDFNCSDILDFNCRYTLYLPILYTYLESSFYQSCTRHTLRYSIGFAAMDKGIGKLINTLKSTDLWRSTVVIFSTDNGGRAKRGASNWPLKGDKGTHYEGGKWF